MTAAPDPSALDKASRASPGERIYAARIILAAAAGSLLIASLFFGLPIAYSASAIVVLLLIATFVPRGRPALRLDDETRDRMSVWPNTPMKTVVEVLPQAALLLDAGGVVRYVNQRAALLFPATRPGDPFTLTFRWPEFSEALDEAQAGRTGSVEFSEPGESASVYAVTLSPLAAPGTNDGFILVSFSDVSDRVAIARMRADFVANASHELRTPLASLTGFIETLLGSARNDAAATDKFLRIMLDQARRMRRLIDDLLSLSRAEMRAHSRPTGRADVGVVLRHVGDALTPLATEHAVVVAIDAPQKPVFVVGDRDELVQLVQNLVENAIRYGASGGRVDVRLELKGGERPLALVHVQDYGPGIAPEHLPRLTERFYRVDVGASREMKGTGLGLAIVKHILTRHSGQLEVKSRQGQGACFTVSLPLAGKVEEAAPNN
jgi:two-component system, OmpR family, phosphate regulon sensor histidine kinase PhoR